MQSDADIVIRNLQPEDDLLGFSLSGKSNRPLKVFLRRQALPFEANNLTRTWVAAQNENGPILGFITIVSGEVEVKRTQDVNHDGPLEFRYPFFPAIKIARLAVDDRYSGKSLGRALVDYALGIAKHQICPVVGCRFAIVDAKKQSVGFYRKCGFTLLNTPDNHSQPTPFMFLDLKWHPQNQPC